MGKGHESSRMGRTLRWGKNANTKQIGKTRDYMAKNPRPRDSGQMSKKVKKLIVRGCS